MKTYSNQLFELIKAMSPNEKLYFKVFGANKKHTNQDYSYIILFDTLNTMKVYDEATLQKKLKKANFKHSTEKAKNYLTEALLKSLAEYHTDSLVDVQIHNLLVQAEILYKKNLKKMGAQLLHKAEQLSLEFEKHEYLLMIYSLKTNLAFDTPDLEAIKELSKTGIKKRGHYLDLYNNTIAYSNLAIEIGSIYHQSPNVASGDKETEIRLKKLFAHPLLKDSKSALSFSAKQYFYKLHYQHLVNLYKGDSWEEMSYRMLKEWVAYLEKETALCKNSPEVYIQALTHLMVSLTFKGGKIEPEPLFNKARNFFMSLPRKIINHSVQRTFMDMFTAYTDAQLKSLHPEKCIEAFIGMDSPKLTIVGYANMCLSYFLLGKYSEALACVNKIVNIKSDYRMDMQAFAKLFVLIIHYELRNTDLLPYIAKANERWLIKHNYLPGNFEKALINFFKYKLSKMDSIKEEREELSHILTQLKQDKNPDYSIFKKEEFDYVSWLESKIKNHPLIDVAREKAIFLTN